MKAIIRLKSFEGHAGIPGHQGGSLPRSVPLTKGNVSKFIQWTSSKYNDYSKAYVVDEAMKILRDDNWVPTWNHMVEPGQITKPLDAERQYVKVTKRTFSAGSFTTSSAMGGTDYFVNGDEGYIARGHIGTDDAFIEQERTYFK